MPALDQPADAPPVDDGNSEPSLQRRGVDSAADAQAHYQGLVGGLAWVEQRFFHDSVAASGDRGQEVLRLPVPHRPRSETASVCTGPDSRIVAVAPVGEVVAALGAGSGVVADLVGRQAGG